MSIYFEWFDADGVRQKLPITNRRSAIVPGSRYFETAKYGNAILRKPHTLQERKMDQAHRSDEDVVAMRIKLRQCRSAAALPTVNDDQTRSDYVHRKSWKSNSTRRKPWRG